MANSTPRMAAVWKGGLNSWHVVVFKMRWPGAWPGGTVEKLPTLLSAVFFLSLSDFRELS